MENSGSHLTQGRNSTRADETDARNPTEGGRIFGLLVSDQRAKLGLSQAELAARLQTSRSTVSRIERGHPPSPEIEYRLAAVLDPETPPGPMARLVSRVARGIEGRTLHVPVGSHSRWGIAVLAFVTPLFVMGGFASRDLTLTDGQTTADRGSSVPRDSLLALSEPAIPADLGQKTGHSSAPARHPGAPGADAAGDGSVVDAGEGDPDRAAEERFALRTFRPVISDGFGPESTAACHATQPVSCAQRGQPWDQRRWRRDQRRWLLRWEHQRRRQRIHQRIDQHIDQWIKRRH